MPHRAQSVGCHSHARTCLYGCHSCLCQSKKSVGWNSYPWTGLWCWCHPCWRRSHSWCHPCRHDLGCHSQACRSCHSYAKEAEVAVGWNPCHHGQCHPYARRCHTIYVHSWDYSHGRHWACYSYPWPYCIAGTHDSRAVQHAAVGEGHWGQEQASVWWGIREHVFHGWLQNSGSTCLLCSNQNTCSQASGKPPHHWVALHCTQSLRRIAISNMMSQKKQLISYPALQWWWNSAMRSSWWGILGLSCMDTWERSIQRFLAPSWEPCR